MLKKLCSYLIIFAILHTDAVWAGNGNVRGIREEFVDNRGSRISVQSDTESQTTVHTTAPTKRKKAPTPKPTTPLIQAQSVELTDWVVIGEESNTPSSAISYGSLSSDPPKEGEGIPSLNGINFEAIARAGERRGTSPSSSKSSNGTPSSLALGSADVSNSPPKRPGRPKADTPPSSDDEITFNHNTPAVLTASDRPQEPDPEIPSSEEWCLLEDMSQMPQIIETNSIQTPESKPQLISKNHPLIPHCLKKRDTIVGESENDLRPITLCSMPDDPAQTIVLLQPPAPPSKLETMLDELDVGVCNSLKEHVTFWENALAMSFGAVVGGMTAYGTSDLYVHSILKLATQYDRSFQYLLVGTYLSNYIFYSSLCDTVTRNALYGKKALSYLSRRGANMKDAIFLGALAFCPSLITPFANIAAGFEKIDFYHPEKSLQDMLVFSPILYLNDWAFNIYMASDIRRNIKKWVKTSDSCFAKFLSNRFFYASPPSEEEIRKRNFNKKFDTLIHNLPSLSNEEVGEIYETLKSAKTTIATELPDLDPENYEVAQSFLEFRYLLSLGDGMAQAIQHLKAKPNLTLTKDKERDLRILSEPVNGIPLSSSLLLSEDEMGTSHSPTYWRELYEKITGVITYTYLALGTPARLIVLKFISYDIIGNSMDIILSFFGHQVTELDSVVAPLSWLIATVIGLPIQTGFEYKCMTNCVNMFWRKKYHGHESYPLARKSVQFISVLQGLILTAPIGILALEACTKQFGEYWLHDPEFTVYKWLTFSSILTYLVPEWAVQTTLIEDAFNREIITGVTDGYHQGIPYVYNEYIQPRWNKYGGNMSPLKNMDPSRAYKQDWIIRFIKEKQEKMNNLHPAILLHLENLLKKEKAPA